MEVHIWLHDRWHKHIDFNDALELASEYYAQHGFVQTIILEASTNRVVNYFKIKDRESWYSFEELVELSAYLTIEIIDAIHFDS